MFQLKLWDPGLAPHFRWRKIWIGWYYLQSRVNPPCLFFKKIRNPHFGWFKKKKTPKKNMVKVNLDFRNPFFGYPLPSAHLRPLKRTKGAEGFRAWRFTVIGASRYVMTGSLCHGWWNTWNLFVLYFGASTLQKKAFSNENRVIWVPGINNPHIPG